MISSREYPNWLNGFFNTFGKMQKEADTNVKDLPKIVWNGETFYVSFNQENDSAEIINGFGVVVTTIKNVKTLDDVDYHLNRSQIVASLDENAQEDAQEDAQDKLAEDNLIETELSKVISYIEDESETQPDVKEQLESENIETPDGLDLYVKLAEMQDQINSLHEELASIKSQEHAFVDPGNVYDLNVSDVEQKQFEDAALQTQKDIDTEHSLDLTMQQNRVTLEDIKKSLVDFVVDDFNEADFNEEELPLDDFVNEDLPEIDEVVVEETPTDSITVEDVPVEELPEEIELDLIPENETIEELPTEKLPTEDQNKDKETKPEKLTDEEEEKFAKGICAHCNSKMLKEANTNKNIIGVYCKKCSTEYAVNSDTYDIYKMTKFAEADDMKYLDKRSKTNPGIKTHIVKAGYEVTEDNVKEMLTYLGVEPNDQTVREVMGHCSANGMEINMINIHSYLQSKNILSKKIDKRLKKN